jgi:hypothetical protein
VTGCMDRGKSALHGPCGILCTSDGSKLYICEQLGSKVSEFVISTGQYRVVAGGVVVTDDGPSATEGMFFPMFAVFDNCTAVKESVLYITAHESIKKLQLSIGMLLRAPYGR